MSTKNVVETIYGKYSKYEIVKEVGWSVKFYVNRNGKHYRGSFSSLRDAVEAAKKYAEKES